MPLNTNPLYPKREQSPSPLISIIVATFNSEGTIAKTIESILGQTYNEIEILIIDGASSDKTCEVALASQDSRISIISEPDTGIYNAWNKGLKSCSGEYLLFLGSDDTFHDEEALNRLVRSSQENSTHLFWYGTTEKIGLQGLPICRIGRTWVDIHSFQFHHIHASTSNPMMSALYRSKIVIALGFDESLRITADYDMLIRMCNEYELSYPYFIKSGHPIISMGYGGVSTSPKSALECLKETINIRKKYSLSNVNLTILTRLIKILTLLGVQAILGNRIRDKLLSTYHRARSL